MGSNKEIITAIVIEETSPLTLTELAAAIHVQETFVVELVEHELLQPSGKQPEDWQFDSLSLRRARTAASFYHDLEVNLAGVSLALDLLEQIDELQSQLDIAVPFQDKF